MAYRARLDSLPRCTAYVTDATDLRFNPGLPTTTSTSPSRAVDAAARPEQAKPAVLREAVLQEAVLQEAVLPAAVRQERAPAVRRARAKPAVLPAAVRQEAVRQEQAWTGRYPGQNLP
jgi:hypothetical protein